MIIRDERHRDIEPIRRLVTDVLEPAEALLVDELRADGHVALSLVAEEEGRVVGHILFSPVEAPFRALALAPLSVASDRQGVGIGGALVREGLDRARQLGWNAAFVFGDPDYYGRFGFDLANAAGFDCVFAGPYLMALSLRGALPIRTGAIHYPRPFERFQ